MALCQVHYWKPLAGESGSYTLLSRHRGTRRAVVFVHGFNGDAIATWANFQTEVDQVNEGLSWWATSDLYFFQYPSVESSIPKSANAFLSFLQRYTPMPSASLFQPDRGLTVDFGVSSTDIVPLRTPLDYEELVLVGHSQGAVVIRQTVLYALDVAAADISKGALPAFHELLLNAKICLFSPAHRGEHLSGIAGLITEIPLASWPFQAALRNFSPSYVQLQKGSEFLEDLRTRTMKAWYDHGYPALRAYCIYPDSEQVVNDLNFEHDAVPIYETGQTHTSVCKPRSGYVKPLDFVRHADSRQIAAIQRG